MTKEAQNLVCGDDLCRNFRLRIARFQGAVDLYDGGLAASIKDALFRRLIGGFSRVIRRSTMLRGTLSLGKGTLEI